MTKQGKKLEEKEAVIWDQKRQIRDRDSQIAIAEAEKDLALRDLKKK